MHSSISVSNSTPGHPVGAARAIWLLLLGCLLIAGAAEAVARLALDRVSKIQRRTALEYEAARSIGGDDSSGRRPLLVVGNSLLDEGVRFDRVHAALNERWDARRFVVEQTYYYDWYYGLRRLFREGSRPEVVAIMLSPLQWFRSDSRGDYSAQFLMSAVDLPRAAHDLGLHPTQATNLVFAKASKFWGARTEIRNFVLGRAIPGLGALMNLSSVVDPHQLTDEEVEGVAKDRLDRLNEIVRANGAQLIVLVPPIMKTPDGSLGLVRAAQRAGIAALRPVVSGAYGQEMYRDAGFHLNPVGATAFTERLIPALQDELGSMPELERRQARRDR
jgi:hypothetical protein